MVVFAFTARAMDDPDSRLDKVIRNYIVTQHPEWTGEDIRITLALPSDLSATLSRWPEKTKLKVLNLQANFKPVGNVIFPVEMSCQGETKKVLVKARVAVFQNVVAAARPIKKGTILGPADFKLEARDIAQLPDKYFNNYYLLSGKESKLSIPKNSTILEWMVGAQPTIKKGNTVNILVRGTGLLVKARGEAIEDGYQGMQVRVKRADSKQALKAKVISQNEVEVITE